METFAALAHGMAVAMQPMNLLYALIGVFLGTAVGVLPGIGPALTVALLLPVTYKLDPGGEGRPRRSGAGDLCNRLDCRGHAGHHWSGLPRAVAGRFCGTLRA
jgi:hypothetical protein